MNSIPAIFKFNLELEDTLPKGVKISAKHSQGQFWLRNSQGKETFWVQEQLAFRNSFGSKQFGFRKSNGSGTVSVQEQLSFRNIFSVQEQFWSQSSETVRSQEQLWSQEQLRFRSSQVSKPILMTRSLKYVLLFIILWLQYQVFKIFQIFIC